MISDISKSIACFFAEKGYIKRENVEYYSFGFAKIISDALIWLLVFAISLAVRRVLETAVYVFTFVVMRHCAGGYHAKTAARCNIIFIASYLLFLFVLWLVPQTGYKWLLYIGIPIFELIFLILAPIEHENKKCTEEELKKYRIKTISYSLIFVLLSVAGVHIGNMQIINICGFCVMVGFAASALSVAAAFIQKSGKEGRR